MCTFKFIIVQLLLCWVVTSTTFAQDSLLVSYQGILSDNSSNPITGTHSITFSIYDGAGVSKWSETNPTVQVFNGLFNVILGSHSALPDSVFTGDDRYLGIAVGADPEISPRTLFTSAPGAAYAKRVAGDIETGEGSLNLKSASGDLAFSMTTTERSQTNFRMYNISPGYVGQTQLNLSTGDYGGGIELYPTGEIQSSPAFTIGLEPSPFRYPYLSFYDPSGSFPNDPSIKMGVEPSPFIEMTEQSTGYGDRPLMRMGIEPSPWHKGYLAFQYPEIDPPPVMFEMGVLNDGSEWSSGIDMYLVHPPEYPSPKQILSIGSAPSTGANFKMFNPQPEPPALYFELNANTESGPSMSFHDDVGKVMGIEPSPFNEGYSINFIDPGDDENLLEINANYSTDESSIRMIDPGDDERALIEMNGSNSGPSIYLFNPQPEPPAKLFELSALLGVKSSDDVIMKLTSADGQYVTKLTPGRVKVGHPTNDLYPRSELNAGADSITFFLQGNTAVLDGPPITMLSSSSEAKIGIGTMTPSEPLVVGEDITWFDGTMITVSDQNPTEYSGIAFGENNNNRGWMAYENDGDYVCFGTRENGTFYNWALVFKEGKCGIGTNAPNYDLDVRGTIGNNTTLYHSDRRWKRSIQKLNGSLDRIIKLQGVKYNWRQDEYPEMNFPNGEQIGLIAQDVETIIPEVVNESADGYKSIEYAKLVSVLIESIKEQQKQIEVLSKRLAELEAIELSKR